MPPLLYHISLAFLKKHLPIKEINKNLYVKGVFFTLQIMIGKKNHHCVQAMLKSFEY
jgi:hypothetical protein